MGGRNSAKTEFLTSLLVFTFVSSIIGSIRFCLKNYEFQLDHTHFSSQVPSHLLPGGDWDTENAATTTKLATYQ